MLESTLIGAITGFGGSLFSGIIGYFTLKEKNRHEIAQWAHEKDMLETTKKLEIEVHEAKAVDEEHGRLLEHDKAINGVRAWVRPILTYFFVGVYFIEVALVLTGYFPTDLTATQIAIISGFNMFTGAILTFWFGNRSLEKIQKMFGIQLK